MPVGIIIVATSYTNSLMTCTLLQLGFCGGNSPITQASVVYSSPAS